MKKSESQSASNSILKSGRYVFYVKGDRNFLVSVPEKDAEGVYSKRRIFLLENPEVIEPNYNIFGSAYNVSMFVANLTFPKGQAKISKITRQEFCNTERVVNNFKSIKREINLGAKSVLVSNELISYRIYKSRQVIWQTYVGTYQGSRTIYSSSNLIEVNFDDCVKKYPDGSFTEVNDYSCWYDKNLALQGLGAMKKGDVFMFEVAEEAPKKTKKSAPKSKINLLI